MAYDPNAYNMNPNPGIGTVQVNPNAAPLPMAGQPTPMAQSMQQSTPGGLLGNISQPQYGAGGAPSNTGGSSFGSPMAAQNYRSQNSSMSTGGPAIASNYDYDTGIGAFQQYSDSAYNQGLTRMQPQIDASNRALQDRLVAQGLSPNTPAYNAAMSQQGRMDNDMLNTLNASAQQQGLAAQNQAFGQQLGYDTLDNQRTIAGMQAQASLAGSMASAGASRYGADQQNYRADLANGLGYSQLNEQGRQFNVNDIFRTQGQDQNYQLGLLGANNAAQQTAQNGFALDNNAQNMWFNQGQGLIGNAPVPNFNPVTGLAQGSMQAGNNYAGAQANSNSAMGDLIGVGMSMLPALSDVRAKKNIKRVGKVNNVEVYEWDYKGGTGRYRGVLAHLVAKTHPHAIKVIGGIKHVIYDLLPVNMERIA